MAMNPAELRELSVEDLRVRERELDEMLFRMRLQKATAQLESTAKLQTARRDLARVKTILREKSAQQSAR
jgi:large subunit ribosomal protein L29